VTKPAIRKPSFLGLILAAATLFALPANRTTRAILPGAAAQVPAAAPPGQLTIDQIGQALDKYGKNASTNNGQTTYSITVTHGKWNINLLISLSPNNSVIWITNDMADIPDTSKASPDALAKILEKNTDIGPMFFSILGQNHTLRLSNPVPNHDMTVDALQSQIEAVLSTVADTAPLWAPDALTPNNPLNH